MHKDKPPGIFDFAERSIRYLIGFGLITGFILSIPVHIGLLVWRVDAKNPGANGNPDELERQTAKVRPPSSSPAATAAVRY